MLHTGRGLSLWIVLLVGMLGVGMSFASVASAQDAATVAVEAPVEAATEAAVEADAGDISYISEADFNYTINTLIMFVCRVGNFHAGRLRDGRSRAQRS